MAADSARSWEERDNFILRAAGFEPTEGVLWMRGGMFFGKEAALQRARRELRERGESPDP